MKRPVIFLVLFLISFSCLSSLRADESFRIHERRWKEVYSAKGQNNAVSVLTFPQIRSLINSVKQGKPGNVSPGSTIEFRGFFKPETENSFRITEDDYAVSEFCDSCMKKVAQESPRVIAPPQAIQGLSPGLIRVQGKVRIKLDRSQKSEPLIEIEAENISIPDTSTQ